MGHSGFKKAGPRILGFVDNHIRFKDFLSTASKSPGSLIKRADSWGLNLDLMIRQSVGGRLITHICVKVPCDPYAPRCLRSMVLHWPWIEANLKMEIFQSVQGLQSNLLSHEIITCGIIINRVLIIYIYTHIPLYVYIYIYDIHIKSYKDLDVLFCEKKGCWACQLTVWASQ